jgi:hypothetical protein
MNLPNGVIRQSFPPVRSIFRSVSYVPKRLTNYGDDRRLVDRQFSRELNVQGKSRPGPGENRLPYLAPLRFGRHFNDYRTRLIASRILQRQV